MRYTLTEQEIALLSAYHDGEVTAAERAEVQRLLERTPEAQAWLRDAKSVQTLSVGAITAATMGMSSSSKLSGQAIVAAAAKRGPGGFFSAMQSPLGMAGVAAVLVAGAILAFKPFQNTSSISEQETSISVAEERTQTQEEPTVSAIPASYLATLDTSALMVPPITAHDLVHFALQGVIPINDERTQFVGMDSDSDSDIEPSLARSIESRLGLLDKSGIKTLDSLAKLLRSSVVKVQENSCAASSDIPDIRLSVIQKLEETSSLPKTARRSLAVAKSNAQQEDRKMASALESEMQKMKEALIKGGNKPYVLIETETHVENPTGDRKQATVLGIIGPRTEVIVLNRESIRITNPNLNIAPPKRIVQSTSPKKPPHSQPLASVDDQSAIESGSDVSSWELYANQPFMQLVTINLISNSSIQVVVCDEIDTTWESPTFQQEVIYAIGPQIDSLTDILNMRINNIAKDRSQSPEERARKILDEQEKYERRLQEMIDRINREDENKDAESLHVPENNSELMHRNPKQDSAKEVSVWSDCSLLQDCTG